MNTYRPNPIIPPWQMAQAAQQLRADQQRSALLQMQMDAALREQGERRNALQQQATDDALMKRLFGMPTEQPMPQGMTGPGAPMPNSGVDPRTFLAQGGSMGALPRVQAVNQLVAPPVQKVARTIEIRGKDGKPYTVQVDERGEVVGAPMPKWVAPNLQNLGNRVQAIDPTEVSNGQQFPVGMKPGEQERIDIARTTAGAAARQAAAAEDANRVAREQQGVLRGQQIAEGEAKAKDRTLKRDSAIANFESAIGVIDKALNHPGRETATGLSGQIDPRNYMAGTDAKNFQIVARQLEGQAFLEAFESLKGGGQITQIEGEKATAAKARLDRAQSDAEYAQALNDLRAIVNGAYKRLTGRDYAAPLPQVDTSIGVPKVKFLGFEGP